MGCDRATVTFVILFSLTWMLSAEEAEQQLYAPTGQDINAIAASLPQKDFANADSLVAHLKKSFASPHNRNLRSEVVDPLYFSPEKHANGLAIIKGQLAKDAESHRAILLANTGIGSLVSGNVEGGLERAYAIAAERASSDAHTLFDLLLVNELIWHFDIHKAPQRFPAIVSEKDWLILEQSKSLCYQLLAIKAAQDVGTTPKELVKYYQRKMTHPLGQMRFLAIRELIYAPLDHDVKESIVQRYQEKEAQRKNDGSTHSKFRVDCTLHGDPAKAAGTLMQVLKSVDLF